MLPEKRDMGTALPAREGAGRLPEVLTDLCERNGHSDFVRNEFSDLLGAEGGGAVSTSS